MANLPDRNGVASSIRYPLPQPPSTPFAQGDKQQWTWNFTQPLAQPLQVEVLIPLRLFLARKRQYRFEATQGAFVQTFVKEPQETYHIAIQCARALPPQTSLVSGTLTAIDEATGADVTATVLADDAATIQGTDALLTPQAGTHAHDYLLTVALELSPAGTLVERLRMQVREKL